MKNKIIPTSLLLMLLTVFVCVKGKNIWAINLSIHIPEKYLEIVAGERLAFEIDVKYPENRARKDLRLTYQIKKGDEVVSEAKTLKAIETQSSFMDYMVVPESLDVGMYTISDRIQDYENLNEEISGTFRVIKGPADLMKYIYILGGVVGIVTIFVLFELFAILRLKEKVEYGKR